MERAFVGMTYSSLISVIVAAPLDVTAVILAVIAALPGTIAATIAAYMTLHNRTIAKDTNNTAKETKTLVNGRMDQLLAAAQELSEERGRRAAMSEASVVKAQIEEAKSGIQ